MSHPKAHFDDSLISNIAALKTLWNRQPFHDMSTESLVRVNKRVVITLDEYILVLTGVTRFTEHLEQFPASWLTDSIVPGKGSAVLHVEGEFGEFEAVFQNLRLLRRNDFTILIPAVDG